MQRDDAFIDHVLSEIATLWKRQPDLRLGQLIVNAVRPAQPCPEIFAIEDEKLLRELARCVDRFAGAKVRRAEN